MAVVALNGEGEVAMVDILAREVLEHDVDGVGVFDETHSLDVGALLVLKLHIVALAMIETAELG